MNFSLNHLALPSHDLDLAEHFYSQILKIPLLKYQFDDYQNKRSLWYQAKSFILMIELTNKPIFQNENTVIAFDINEDERLNLTQSLLDAQISIHKQTAATLYFRDPSGNMLAFSHFK